jgi:hypothetical protein
MLLTEIWNGWTVISSLGTLIAAIVALFYTIFTYRLLSRTNATFHKTNSINEFLIYKEISEKLVADKIVLLIDRCIDGSIIVDYDNKSDETGNIFKSNTINRCLLNPLEDIFIFWEKDLISIETINSGFGYKILSVGNCPAISKHVKDIRVVMPSVYDGFEKLYNAIYLNSSKSEREGFNAQFIII